MAPQRSYVSVLLCSLGLAKGSAPLDDQSLVQIVEKGALDELKDAVFGHKDPAEHAYNIGHEDCRCIGVNGIEGTTEVSVVGPDGAAVVVGFERDMGSRCEPWDDGKHPLCTGDAPPEWCKATWCYVDPCMCRNQTIRPKLNTYLPKDAKYKGRPVHYSYVTCGNEDPFEPPVEGYIACGLRAGKDDCASSSNCTWEAEKCYNKETAETCKIVADETVVGSKECPCVGVEKRPGMANLSIHANGSAEPSIVSFPADTGSHCKPWDLTKHPDCKDAAKPADWCVKKWCYVDPCNCHLELPPIQIDYLPGGTFQGHQVYYSYKTCGEKPYEGERDIPAEQKKISDMCAIPVPSPVAGATAPVPGHAPAPAPGSAPAAGAPGPAAKNAASRGSMAVAAVLASLTSLLA